MANLLDYAALSAAVYQNARGIYNVNPLPSGWAEIAYASGGLFDAFTAGAYKNGNDVVIAFKGTDIALSSAANTAGDVASDIALGAGVGSTQLFQAALFYEQIKAANPGANITFTGHSLGGGLASIMSVWFNRPATTFDEAPFEATALNPVIMAGVSAYLGLNGYSDSDFLNFFFTYPVIYGRREAQVTNYFTKGEFLELGRATWPTVVGADNPILIGGGQSIPGLTLHSMNLAAALLMQDKLRIDTLSLPNLLPAIFNEKLYAMPLLGKDRDFLTALLNDQINLGYTNPNGLLARFAGDMGKLTQYGANLKDGALSKALTAAAIEDYYFMQNGITHDFFYAFSGGISFDLKDIGTGWSNKKAAPQLVGAVIAEFLNGDLQARSYLTQDNYWTIQSGSGALNVTGAGANNDAMLGGATNDILGGGDGNDFLYGGSGADALTGGAGNDLLEGGAGNDTYYAGGGDKVFDSDGQGAIYFDNALLSGGDSQDGGHTWQSADGSHHYVVASGDINAADGATLIVDGSLTIQHFHNNDLGISLQNGVTLQQTATTTTITGDYTAITNGLGQYQYDSLGNVITDPNNPYPGRTDFLYDSGGNDRIEGKGGNDSIYATRGGDDRLLGGTGNDYIISGAGNDLAEGGSGGDIVSGGSGNDQLFAEDYGDMAALVAQGETAASINQFGDLLSGNAGNDFVFGSNANDLLFGGDGNDLVVGGGGNDIIFGEQDVIPGEGAWSFSVTPDGSGALSISATNMAINSASYIGADTLYGGTGADQIFGGGGDDGIFGGEGNDWLQGDDGNDVMAGDGGDDQMLGGTGNDYLDGGAGSDKIYGMAGDDELFGGDGDDQLDGGSGNNYLDGEAGNDTLFGGEESDELFGGDGADRLQGAAGDDYLDGEADADILIGQDGNDTLYGGAGNDELQGNAGDDALDGEDGNDLMFGQEGIDQLDGGAGNDELHGGDGNDALFGSAGIDNLGGGAGNDTLDGGDNNDDLFGEGDADSLYGGAGDDQLSGDAGSDTLSGGDGNDVYICNRGDGADTIADNGDLVSIDTLQFGANILQNDVTITRLGNGDLSFHINGTADEVVVQGYYNDAGNRIEQVVFGDGIWLTDADFAGLPISGTSSDDVLTGTADDDTLMGLAGNDTLDGGGGNDSLQGDTGHDTYLFNLGDGQDTIFDHDASAGNIDTIRFGAGITASDITFIRNDKNLTLGINGSGDQVSIANWGDGDAWHIERVEFADGTAWDVVYLQSQAAGIPIIATNGNDYLQVWSDENATIQGMGGDDTLIGGAGYDVLDGGAGNDVIRGGAGNDALSGSAGDDWLYGGSGDDRLESSAGSDILEGGPGNDFLYDSGGSDYFNFNRGDGQDTILQFGNIYWDTDSIYLGEGIAPGDITATRTGQGLVLSINGTDDRLTIQYWRPGSMYNFDYVQFADRVSYWTESYFMNVPITGTTSTDYLYGDYWNNTIMGGGGVDRLDGGTGNDTIYSGDHPDEAMDAVTVVSAEEDGTIPSATITGTATNYILKGTISDANQFGGYDYDFYKLENLSAGTVISAVVFSDFDTALGLYDSSGISLYENGDAWWEEWGAVSPNDLDAALKFTISTGGDYYLAVASSDSWLPTDPFTTEYNNYGIWAKGDYIATVSLSGDYITPPGLSSLISGGRGNDVIYGGVGNDTYQFWKGDGNDTITDHDATPGNIDVLSLQDATPADVALGRNGDDLVVNVGTTDSVIVKDWWLSGDTSYHVEQIKFSDGSVWDYGAIEAIGNAPIDINDFVVGTSGDDVVSSIGNTGSSFLYGGAGNDTLIGQQGDTFAFSLGSGVDTVNVTRGILYNFKTMIQIEYAYYQEQVRLGLGSLMLSYGNQGDVVHIEGFNPNDVYGSQVIDEFRFSDRTFTWSELLDLGFDLYGTAGNDVMTGTNVTDRFYGGAGNDTLSGGAGNDAYTFNIGDGRDTIIDQDATAGNVDVILMEAGVQPSAVSVQRNGDNLVLSIGGADDSITLNGWFTGDENKIEKVQFADGTTWNVAAIEGILNPPPPANMITGSAASESIHGTTGSDYMQALGGDDYVYGGDGDDALYGGDGNDYLKGDAGSDAMTGGLGNDTYVVDAVGDTVTESLNEGTDTVKSSITYTLGDNLENLTLTGADSIYGTGNDLGNTIYGNAAANVLNAGGGNDYVYGGNGDDTMYGGDGNDYLKGDAGSDAMTGALGNDTYVVDAVGDTVTESLDEGTDTVKSSITYTLGENLENLTLIDTLAINGTGNELNNTITGNAAANMLSAGSGNDYIYGGDGDDALYGGDGNDYLKGDAGSDAMTGALGNDTYVVDAVGDTVTESLDEGADTVKSSITYTLGENLENLTLTGTSAINGTGNDLNNSITGNAAANVLSAGGGNDYIYGGDGDDILQGGDGNDYLKGDAGSDAMTGGMGNDTYVVDAVGDMVTESLNEWADTVKSSITYTLGENLENLTLTGTSAINGTGNDLNNSITGNAAANMLSAGGGNDYIYGGDGDDILQGGDGNDYLRGDAGNNLLNGGAGTDTLTGNAGNELFIGGTGADTITTGTGSDVIDFNRGDGQDMIAASVGADDTISLGGGINYQSLTMRKSGNNLILDAGNSDQVTMQNWFAGAENHNVINLQIVLDNATYNASSIDPLLNKQVQRFDFAALTQGFDQALGVNPALSAWSLTDSLLSAHLAGSDTEALGGDLAYQYNLNGSLAGIGVAAAQAVLGDANFGVAPQLLKPLADLQSGVARLG